MSASIPTDRRPSPVPRTFRTFRIRGVMLLIAVLAGWFGMFRAWPVLAVLLAVLAGPTWGFYRWFVREAELDEGTPPGTIVRGVLLFAALTIATIVVPTTVFVLVLIAGAFSKLLGPSG